MLNFRIVLLSALLLMFNSISAFALSLDGNKLVVDYNDTTNVIYYDTGAEAVKLTDTDGTKDDLNTEVLLTLAGWKSTNIFGFYDFTTDDAGNVHIGDKLQVFSGASENTEVTIRFDLVNGTADLVNDKVDDIVNMGTTFGLYIDSTQSGSDLGGIFYSHSALNEGGYDYFWIYDLLQWPYSGCDVIVAIEDQFKGGVDGDHNDLIVGIDDVAPAPVPEPATMLLLGTGLIGMAGASRKKLFRK